MRDQIRLEMFEMLCGRRAFLRAAALLGQRVELVTVEAASVESVAAAGARLLREEQVFALLGGLDEPAASALGEVAERQPALFLNLGSASDVLRGERCRRTTFHVQASEAMYRDALSEWQAAGEGRAGGGERPALWHHELERFGAGQLNDRYRARFGRAMEPLAWAGWMAVKVLWEAAARARATDAAALLAFLESGRARFDGHKGTQLSFRRWDHQLRQPLYIVRSGQNAPGEVVAEVPVAACGSEQSPQELLDRLGAGESDSGCTFARQ
ncbi:hypothetical protein BH23GEM7_BH23GEM7_22680 [soil metagenome]